MQITVQGFHEEKLPAELGTIHLAASFESGDKAQAMRLTQELAAAVRGELEHLSGIGGDSAPLDRFNVDAISTRSWRPHDQSGKLRPMRFTARVGMRAAFRDFSALSDFAAKWGEVDGVSINRIAWSLTDATQTERENDVLASAIIKAKRRAAHMAATLGVGDVRCTQIADPGLLRGAAEPAPEARMMRMGAMAAPASDGGGVELTPEDITLSATVHAVFEAQ